MRIKQSLCITSRLLPGVRIGGAEVSIEYAGIDLVSRRVYRWFIDGVDCPVMQSGYYGVKVDYQKSFQGEDLRSGVGGGSLQEGLESLFVFLGAFADAIAYQERTGLTSENSDLFPAQLAEWATKNSDEIGMLACMLEENPGEFIVE